MFTALRSPLVVTQANAIRMIQPVVGLKQTLRVTQARHLLLNEPFTSLMLSQSQPAP